MKREVEALTDRRFDVLVIGGGIVGACVARDAALRGLDVALVDRADIGGGASANCLKIVHGGLRYLQRLDLSRMRASIRERSTWLRIAPHLVEPMPFVLPTYRTGLDRRAVYRAALAVNDALSWDRNRGLAAERRLPPGRMLTREECLALVPELEAPGLTGGALVQDAQLYSAERLVLEVARDAHGAGAVVANYVELERPVVRGGRLVGCRLRDRPTDRCLEVRARLVVNACGSGVRDIAGRLTGRAVAVPPFRLALNVVVPALGHAVGFAIAGAGRKFFLAPWRGRTLIGTGQYDWVGDPDSPEVERWVRSFLDEVGGVLPTAGLSRDDVLLVHRGLVPLERAPAGGDPELLRHHRVLDHAADGVPEAVSVVAEKFTTARRIAEEVVDLLFRKLGRPAPPCVTAVVPLPAAPRSPAGLLDEALRRFGGRLDRDALERLTRLYGRRYDRVLDRGGRAAELDAGAVLGLEFAHAVREELAFRVDDLLARRTEIGPRGLDVSGAAALAERVLEAARAVLPARPVAVTGTPRPGVRGAAASGSA